jgi:hypothetical protein
LFQETKLELISSSIVRSLWRCQHVDWCYSALRGVSSGILLIWDSRVEEKIEEYVGDFDVVFTFRDIENGFIWPFAGVYGPNSAIFMEGVGWSD